MTVIKLAAVLLTSKPCNTTCRCQKVTHPLNYYLSIVLGLPAVLFLPINRLNSNQKFTYLPGPCVNRIVE